MSFPLIPILLGAAAGSSVTYLAMNKTAKQKITHVTDTVKNAVKATRDKVSGKKETPPAATEPSMPIVEATS